MWEKGLIIFLVEKNFDLIYEGEPTYPLGPRPSDMEK